MDTWINTGALWRVLVDGLIAGAGLPILFSLGIRAQAVGTGDAPSGASARPAATGLAYLCFALVAAAAVVGVLFVARDFIGHHTGWYILGAKEK